MASSDAKPVPQKNVAYRITFPILDADGDLVTGAASLDSEISKDGGTFADCTNEATEIATSSGMYYLDLTSTEMNADTVAVIIKTATSGAKTTPIVMYPEEAGDIRVNVTAYGGTAGTFSGGRPEVNTSHAAGTAWGSGAITAASIATGAITNAKFAAGAIDAAAIAADAIDDSAIASDVTAVIAGAVWNAATASYGTANTYGALIETNIDAAVSTRASQTSVDTIDDFLDTEVAAILADTNELQTDWVNGGRLDLLIDAIKAKTDNLPAAPAATGDIPSAASIADAVWDEALAGHAGAGSAGEALDAAGTAGDPWTTALPGSYSSGQAGYIIGTNINATVSGRASQTSVDTIDGIVDSILVDTAEIGTAGAGLTALATQASVNTIDDFLDTEVAAIKAKTDSLTFTVAGQVDANIQYVNDVAVTGTGASGNEWGPA